MSPGSAGRHGMSCAKEGGRHQGSRVRASAGTMISAATRWLIERTTMVAVVASLVRGSQKEAIVPATATTTNHVRGRGAPPQAGGRERGGHRSAVQEGPQHERRHRHAPEVVAEHLGQLQGHTGTAGDHVHDGVGGCGDQCGNHADLPERPLGPCRSRQRRVAARCGGVATGDDERSPCRRLVGSTAGLRG